MERLGKAGAEFGCLTEAIEYDHSRLSNDDADGRTFAEFDRAMLKDRAPKPVWIQFARKDG